MDKKPSQPGQKPPLKHEYDFDEGGPLSQEYLDAVMPDHVKERIAKRAKKAEPEKK